jgi:hypothetical protein
MLWVAIEIGGNVNDTDYRAAARAEFEQRKQQGVAWLAAELGARPDLVERRLLDDAVRVTPECLLPRELEHLDALPAERMRHAETCSFCAGVIAVSREPVEAESARSFLEALRPY